MMTMLLSLMALLLLSAEFASASHGPGNITVLVPDPLTRTTLYAGTPDGGLLKSLDGTVTWQTTGLAGSVRALAIDPVTPSVLYAGTDHGVVKSSDGGTTWTATGLNGVVETLIIHPVSSTTLYVVLVGTGAFKTDNGGVGWNALGPAQTVVRALAIDHATPTTLYAGGDGVYRSVDGGTSWNSIGLAGHSISALGSYGGALYAVSQNGAFKSIGGGAWTPTAMVPSAMDPQTSTTLYAATVSGVFKSTDDGATWTAANTGLTDVLLAQGATTAVGPLAIDPVTPGILYAATQLGVFKSWDGTPTWQHLGPEDCSNGIDDDGNGLVDSQDPACPLNCFSGEPCPPGYVCNSNGFCESHCGNGFWDGDEGDLDCGGSCSVRCTIGRKCWVSADCTSGICSGSLCVAAIPPSLSSLNLNPSNLTAGSTSTGTAILGALAPTGGAVVTLSSSNTAVAAVPASVTVPAGATTVGFVVTTNVVTSVTAVTISGTSGGVTKSATLTVTPPPALVSISLNPTSVRGGTSSTATITLSGAAPPGGVIVTLSSSQPSVATVPSSITVVAGATSAQVTVSTSRPNKPTDVTISANLANVTKTATLTVKR